MSTPLAMARRVRVFAVVLALAGCAPPPDEIERAQMALGAPALGTGAFEPLREGQEVEAIAGAQGGFHVWMKYRVEGVAGTLKLERTAHRTDDEQLVLRTSGTVALDGGRFESDPVPMFLCPSPIGISVIDRPIRFTLRLVEDGVERASESVTLVPRCPEAQADFCRRICSG